MLKNKNKLVALTTLGVMTATAFGGFTLPAQASTKGKRNTTIGLGALTAYGLLKHNKTATIVGGVGTAIAYSRYSKSKKRDKARRQAWYRQRYGRNWRNHYSG